MSDVIDNDYFKEDVNLLVITYSEIEDLTKGKGFYLWRVLAFKTLVTTHPLTSGNNRF